MHYPLCFLVFSLSLTLHFASSAAIAAEAPPLKLELPATTSPAAAAMQERLYASAQKQLHALLPLVHPWSQDASLLLLTESKSTEHYIRPNAGMIQGMALLYRFGPYDQTITGISREDLLHKKILPMLRYCLLTHHTGDRVTSDGKAWGDAWQSAHWASTIGNAAWYIWEDLPEDLQHRVRKLVAHEADRFTGMAPPYQLRADTKAEENAWNSQILSVAVILMPEDDRRSAWEEAYQRWVLSSFLRPADQKSQTVVDGKTVAEQFTGANLLDDYTLENHGFVHPDYMSTYSQTLGVMLAYRLNGRTPPQALSYNVAPLNENIKWFALPDGGRIYPSGQDWELFRNPGWVYSQLLMSVFLNDPDAWSMAEDSLQTLEKMQARHPAGEVIRHDETRFPSAKTGLFQATAQAWLVLTVAENIVDAPQPKLGVLRLDEGKLILHRTPKTVNTLSWGAKTMAMCVPYRLDRIISPDQRSGIGHIRLAADNKILKVKTLDARVLNDPTSYSAELVLEHGDQAIRAEIQITSGADGLFTLSEKLIALADITTQEIATGLVGVLNNPNWVYETGQRKLALDDEQSIVEALSGQVLEQPETSVITIDNVLQITAVKPLSIQYQAAKDIDRGRATDKLYLNYHNKPQTWQKGQTISEYQVQFQRIGE